MAMGGVGVSLAGFAGLVAALTPQSAQPSPITKWRITHIVVWSFQMALYWVWRGGGLRPCPAHGRDGVAPRRPPHRHGAAPEEDHVVLADPDGNEFCVIEPGNNFLAGCGFLGEVSCHGTPVCSGGTHSGDDVAPPPYSASKSSVVRGGNGHRGELSLAHPTVLLKSLANQP
jgi:hypothetical protein